MGFGTKRTPGRDDVRRDARGRRSSSLGVFGTSYGDEIAVWPLVNFFNSLGSFRPVGASRDLESYDGPISETCIAPPGRRNPVEIRSGKVEWSSDPAAPFFSDL